MRLIRFFDGYTSDLAPSLGHLSATNIRGFEDEVAFLESKGLDVENGDVFFDTTLNVIRYYSNDQWLTIGTLEAITDLQEQINDNTTDISSLTTLTDGLTTSVNDILSDLANIGGDISGDIDDITVDKIKNIPVPAPTIADNSKALVYDHTLEEFIFSEAGGSSGGARNFLQESNISWDGETGTTGFVAYKDAASSRPVDGTGGSPTLIITTSSTNPLTGDNSLIITKTASNLQGEGISADFTIDRANQARSLKVEFDYIVDSGTFTAGSPTTDSDLIVYLYDVTNARLIEPSTFKLFSNSSTTSDKFSGYFQTSPDSTSYRLILHVAASTSSAFTLKLDSLIVTTSGVTIGTPITDPTLFTPTGTLTTNATYSGSWHREGKFLIQKNNILFNGTNTQGTLNIDLVPGLTMDTALIDTTSFRSVVSVQGSFVISGITYDIGAVTIGTNNSIRVVVKNTDTVSTSSADPAMWGSLNTTTNFPATVVNGSYLSLTIKVPIQGWSSSVRMSDGFDARDVVTTLGLASNQTVSSTSETTLLFTSIIDDTVAAYTTNGVRIVSSGYYDLSLVVGFDSTTVITETFQVRLKVDGNTVRTQPVNPTIVTVSHSFLKSIYLQAGQVVTGTVQSTTDTSYVITTSVNTRLTVAKNQSPQTTSMGEVVAMAAQATAGPTITNTISKVVFTAKENDTHNAYSTSSGDFTAPVSGYYNAAWTVLLLNTNLTATERFTSVLYKNGSQYRNGQRANGVGISTSHASSGSANSIYLKAGETLSVWAVSNISGNLDTLSSTNFFTVTKIG